MQYQEISVFSGASSDVLLSQIQDSYLGPRPRVAEKDAVDFIHRKLILEHSVVTNRLYRRLLEGRMTNEQYQYFFSEYNQASQKHFYQVVLPKAKEAHDHPVWRSYIDHIVEEESIPAPHWELFRDFMVECGFRMEEPQETAKKYASSILNGYLSELSFAAGYALALEVQAGYEIAVLYKALQRHFPEELERTEWFSAHLAEGQEEEHSKASVQLVESAIREPHGLREVRAGFIKYCDDVRQFMEEIDRCLGLTVESMAKN